MNDTSTQRHFGLKVPGETHSLSLIRLVMTHLAEMAGFQEEDIGKIEIAVDEACTNVIEHAYHSHSPKPPIRVEVETHPDQFIVRIKDEGIPFDYDSYIPPKFPDHWTEGHTRGVG
ncbi:MAG: ATP-binding protein, partial [Lentisphaerota bacterium]